MQSNWQKKVLVVKKFLDNNFQKNGIPSIDENGYPTTIKIVTMKGTDGQPIKNMNAEQLFYLLQDNLIHYIQIIIKEISF